MNIAERNLDKEYKEWCEKNQDFLKRYMSEFLDEKKDNIEKVINDHIEYIVKKCISNMSTDDWEKILMRPISDDIRYCIDMVLPKAIEDLIFADRNRARPIPDYNHPRYRSYGSF